MKRHDSLQQLQRVIETRLIGPEHSKPLIVSLSGPSGSGKSTLIQAIQETYPRSAVLSTDDYYLGKTRIRNELPLELRDTFEDPRTMDLARLAAHLHAIRQGQSIERPVYDMYTSEPLPETVTINPAETDLILVEGLAANLPILAPYIDIRACATACRKERLARRIARDATRNGASAETVIQDFETIIEPAYAPHYQPFDEQVDFIIRNE